MLKYITFLIFAFVCSTFNVEGQTGLFGSKNGIEFSYSLAPSIKRKKVLITQNAVDTKLRIVNQSFDLTYKRIISNKLSVTVGYGFAKIRSIGSNILQDNVPEIITFYDEFSGEFRTGEFTRSYSWNFVEPKFAYNALTIGIDSYDNNSINPLGFFWGVDVELGRINASFDNILVYNSSVSGGPFQFFSQDDNSVRELSLDSNSRRYSSASLRGHLGKNIIITRNLMLNLNMSANLLSIITGNGEMRSSSSFLDIWATDERIYLSNRKESSLIENAYASLLSYKRFNLGIGLCYYF
ncbi:MAG: hypothetical protein AB8B74_14035 [Crocinitomicaceae bacterium]